MNEFFLIAQDRAIRIGSVTMLIKEGERWAAHRGDGLYSRWSDDTTTVRFLREAPSLIEFKPGVYINKSFVTALWIEKRIEGRWRVSMQVAGEHRMDTDLDTEAEARVLFQRFFAG